jgi:release factor glutamine methyltransferase
LTAVLSAELRAAAATLRAAGIDGAMADARLLVLAAAGLRREDLLREPDAALDDASLGRFREMVVRRAAREPVSRILGRREFMSLEFRLGPDTLDPRPDSETAVEHAIALFGGRAPPGRILDLGTGTGCLLLACLAAWPQATGLGVDIAPGAARIAAANAAALGLGGRASFAVADWGTGLRDRFDLAISNPPYIRSGDIAALAPEVADHDPPAALDGGADGLDAYRAIAGVLGDLLAPDGIAVVEIGAGQETDVRQVFEIEEWRFLGARKDLSGRPRSLAFGAGHPPGSKR